MAPDVVYPVKIYKLGESPMTINAQVDLEYWLGKGFSLTQQVYSHKDFPKVLYARGGAWVSVKDADEMGEYLAQGYGTMPFPVGEAEASEDEAEPETEPTSKEYLQEKVKFHEAKAELYRCKLEELEPAEVSPPAADQQAPAAKKVSKKARRS